MQQNTKYNGWTNYATWRVNLEMIDGSDWHCRFDDHGETPDSYELGLALKDWTEEWIVESSPEGFARDYALAFLSDVNWQEIAQHLINDYSQC